MRGELLAEHFHVVNALPPLDFNGSARNTKVISMARHGHVSFVVSLGAVSAATTVKAQACDDFTPSSTTDIPFAIYKMETTDGDVLGPRTAVAATGVALTTNNNTQYVIEIDAAELPEGKPFVRLNFSDPSAGCLGSVVAVLTGARYAGPESATVLS